ncbi:MAG TPA: hypothetical protein VIX15_13790 [Streptosporangiaceae bacterium]
MIYTAVSAAAIATVGLLASPAMASTTQFPFQGQGFSLYNNYGHASGTVTGGQSDQFGQWGGGSLTVSGTVTNNQFGRYGYGFRRGVTEEVFLSANSWQRGELIGSSRPGQSDQFSGTLYNTDSATITLCAANQWGGNVRDCTSQSVTVQQHNPHHHHH